MEGVVTVQDGLHVPVGASEGLKIREAEHLNAVPEIFLECTVDVTRGAWEHGPKVHVASALFRDRERGGCHRGGGVVVIVRLVVVMVRLVVIGLRQEEVGRPSRVVGGLWGVNGLRLGWWLIGELGEVGGVLRLVGWRGGQRRCGGQRRASTLIAAAGGWYGRGACRRETVGGCGGKQGATQQREPFGSADVAGGGARCVGAGLAECKCDDYGSGQERVVPAWALAAGMGCLWFWVRGVGCAGLQLGRLSPGLDSQMRGPWGRYRRRCG